MHKHSVLFNLKSAGVFLDQNSAVIIIVIVWNQLDVAVLNQSHCVCTYMFSSAGVSLSGETSPGSEPPLDQREASRARRRRSLSTSSASSMLLWAVSLERREEMFSQKRCEVTEWWDETQVDQFFADSYEDIDFSSISRVHSNIVSLTDFTE